MSYCNVIDETSPANCAELYSACDVFAGAAAICAAKHRALIECVDQHNARAKKVN